MEKSKAVRGGHRGAITRLINKTDERFSSDSINNQELAAVIDSLEKKQTVLQILDDQIIELIEAESVEDEISETDDYNLQLEVTIRRFKDMLNSKGKPDATTTQSAEMVSDSINTQSSFSQDSTALYDQNQNTNPCPAQPFIQNVHVSDALPIRPPIYETPMQKRFYHKIPKLDLPTFAGNTLQWQTFWESFESTVHNNPALTNIQKFTYLKAQLRNDAERCITGLSLTHANYEQAIVLLKDRFGQQSKIIDAHMQNLLDLPSPLMTLRSLSTFYDHIETSIRGLESLGQRQETYGSLLTPIIFRKLPAEMRKNLTREHGCNTWDIDSLRKAIRKELQVQEAGQLDYTDDITPTASFVTNATPRPNHRYNANNNNKKPNSENPVIKRCVFCNLPHKSTECTKVKDAESRYAIVKEKQLCFNCLGTHKASECRSRFTCRKCNRKHHTSLCKKENKPENGQASSYSKPTTVNTVSSSNTLTDNNDGTPMSAFHSSSSPVQTNTEVLLKTAIAPVWYGDCSLAANILLDEGSQKSFISEDLAKQLFIEPNGTTTINLATFGDTTRNVRHMDKATISLETEDGRYIPMDVLIVPNIAAPLNNGAHFEVVKLPYLKGLKLAHPVTDDLKFDISLLIGADYYWKIVQDRVIRGQGPTAVQSRLGYLLSGPLIEQSVKSNSTMMMNILINHQRDEHNLERFWNLESMGVSPTESSKETTDFYETYEKTGIEYKDNRYNAKLPWTDECPELPTNKNIVLRRTQNVIRKLQKDPEMLKLYSNIITDQEIRGFIERVPEEEFEDTKMRIHYIPHHAVKKDSATTPIRIVYDCSCRESQNSPSLNDCLMSVPPDLNDLTGLLARFRLHKYGVSTDIEKAFLQIGLDKDDRDVTRFFWLSDPADAESPLVTYRFKAILFGTTCSPFILNATLMKHLKANQCETANIVRRDLYVDNVLSSFSDEDGLVNFYRESRSVLSTGGFNLRSWTSNNTLLRDIATEDHCTDNDKLTKILGLRWDVGTDKLSFQDNIHVSDYQEVTKRDILKESSKIFDPLGILSPVTVRAKLLMQSLWKHNFEWDSCLPDEFKLKWNALLKDLHEAVKLEISRYYFKDSLTDIGNNKLHIFTDASQSAYGACAYIVREDQSSIVMARNRVAPLKSVTLPRLELMGAVLGARLAKHLLDNLGKMDVYFWCYSQIVLSWINSTKPLKVFISNRVKEIKNLTDKAEWRYCPTEMNPADLLTRGITAEKFVNNELWHHGPQWLPNEREWPSWDRNMPTSMIMLVEQELLITNTDNLGVDSCTMMSLSKAGVEEGLGEIVKLNRYSSLLKLLRVTAYVLRFIANCRLKRDNRNFTSLTTYEIQTASMQWIKYVQKSTFNDELNSNKKSSIVRQLRLFYDQNGHLRCGGRIDNANISESAKYPCLLPTNHKFTKLVVQNAHEHSLHGGVNSTITHLRQYYWIPRIRQCVRNILHSCTICRRVTGQAYPTPDPPPLPKDRLQEDVPFKVTGVDFAGPLHIKNSENIKSKVYICLFTCAATRAVHLEIVPNLTEVSFILAFRRFASRRSLPQTIISDNGTTFCAASKEIEQLTRSIFVREQLNRQGTTWKFIPKRAPWYGGFWERMIGLTKTCMKKVLGRNCVNMEILQTVLTEIEAFLNDRPITYISTDINDPQPLTPSHLLCGRRTTCLPYSPGNFDNESELTLSHSNFNNRFHARSNLLEHFWNRWRNEYLTSLREFHRTCGNNNQNIQKGDIVQIENDSPRINWKLAKIEELVYGMDGMIRSAKLRTRTGITNRPISKLYPLEVRSTDVTQQNCKNKGNIKHS